MLRIVTVLATLMASALLVPANAAPPEGIKLGEPLKGELGGIVKGVRFKTGVSVYGYYTGIPVKLKAGDSISLNVTVIGKDRMVALVLIDPTGKLLHDSGAALAVKTAQLTFEEVNVTGTYLIVVLSDLAGPFTLIAASTEQELDKVALKSKIENLEKELAAAKAALETLEKSNKKP